jgi:hypothetical protein
MRKLNYTQLKVYLLFSMGLKPGLLYYGKNTVHVLRRMSGLTRQEIIGGWRKMHSDELHNTYSMCLHLWEIQELHKRF